MAVGDVCTLRIVGRYQAQNIVNTLHYEISDQAATEHVVLGALCEVWASDVGPAFLARHIDTYELIGLKAFRESGVPKVPAYVDYGTNGSVVGIEVPSLVGRVITLYTNSAFYRRRGRLQISGADTTMFNVDDGSVTDVERDLLQVLADLLIVELAAAGNAFNLCIPATDQLALEPIVAARGRKTPSVTRSRRVKNFLIG
jgi:hypothetical protein